jgi:membrane peptidoglycan carboxypeptidase
VWSTLIVLGAAGALSAGIAIALLLSWAARDLPDPTRLISRAVPQSTKIFDRTGEQLLFEFHGDEKRTWRPLDEISSYVAWSTIAIEDRTFYEHQGFRLTSYLRAALANLRRGGRAQGGSTITQQLVKNAILTPEKTYRRKLKELLLSYQVEQKLTKDEILTLYLNEIPFGAVAYGIESAAQTFFGKTAAELDLPESALLAALPKSPTRLSPYGSHTDELLERTHLIIDTLATLGYITTNEARDAKTVPILDRVQERREAIVAPHYVMYVRELLTERYGERLVETGGLTVTTALDLNLLGMAEAAIEAQAERNEKSFDATNAALVAIDPKTGELLTMVGSRDFFNDEIDGQVNVALRPRQPGSSFKPLVYVTMFSRGYTPETLVADVATTFPSPVGAYEPVNYDGEERGFVSFRTALAGSLNIPAVKALYLTGIDRVLDVADRLGYTTLTNRSRFGLALVLGGGEVKLLEHVSAYATLAANGIRRAPTAILRVEQADGTVLEEWSPPAGERIIDEGAVRNLTSIMIDNDARTFAFGARSPLAFTDRDVAAKTGTTNDFRDAWTMGFVPQLAWGVWVGNNDNRPMGARAAGSVVAGPIWRAFADAALKELEPERFPEPSPDSSLGRAHPILRGENPGVVRMNIDRSTGLPANDLTSPELVEQRIFQDLHSILHYIRREEPRGAPPGRPESDPMYAPWEEGIQAWAKKNDITLGPPPDAPSESSRPTIALDVPTTSDTIIGRTIRVAGAVDSPYTTTRITIDIDGVPAALLAPENNRFDRTITLPPSIDRGSRTLRVVACDERGVCGAERIALNIQSPRETITLVWDEPQQGSTIDATSFPITIALTASTTIGASRVEIITNDAGGDRLLTSVVPPADGRIRILWPSAPASGTVTLRALLLRDDAPLAETEPLTLVIE